MKKEFSMVAVFGDKQARLMQKLTDMHIVETLDLKDFSYSNGTLMSTMGMVEGNKYLLSILRKLFLKGWLLAKNEKSKIRDWYMLPRTEEFWSFK